MKQLNVTDRAAVTINELRDGRCNDYNEYDIRMEEIARAIAGLSAMVEQFRLNGDEMQLSNSIIGAIYILGKYTTLLHDLMEERDDADNKYSLNTVSAKNV